jgi:hypothetical protein
MLMDPAYLKFRKGTVGTDLPCSLMSEISIWMTQLKGLEELAQKDPSRS